jgi:hypothetical protein
VLREPPLASAEQVTGPVATDIDALLSDWHGKGSDEPPPIDAQGKDGKRGALPGLKLEWARCAGASSCFRSKGLLTTGANTAREAPQSLLFQRIHVSDTTCRG